MFSFGTWVIRVQSQRTSRPKGGGSCEIGTDSDIGEGGSRK